MERPDIEVLEEMLKHAYSSYRAAQIWLGLGDRTRAIAAVKQEKPYFRAMIYIKSGTPEMALDLLPEIEDRRERLEVLAETKSVDALRTEVMKHYHVARTEAVQYLARVGDCKTILEIMKETGDERTKGDYVELALGKLAK